MLQHAVMPTVPLKLNKAVAVALASSRGVGLQPSTFCQFPPAMRSLAACRKDFVPCTGKLWYAAA